MTHLTPEELIDAVEATRLDGARRAHLHSCETCRREVASLAATLGDARHTDVPEPSPLFWDHFSARVRWAVAAEAAPAESGLWPTLVGWRVLAPLAGVALLVLALIYAVPQPASSPGPGAAAGSGPAIEITATAAEDEGWRLVAEMVSTVDWDTAAEAGLGIRLGSVERAVLDLSVEEQRELRRLLTAELARPKS